ncbi:dTDP-glucose 4,6-dehydratase [Gracilibacillus thailandensis]|uniref:dTDP-glucose 4,6-dehydratase n=1 Tax=Gracilibacillus thailandensis TaxID=563735 RepID=A0A6N7R1F7_9BACI|nr:dTDP-glucose 4,6-dehydratase [Gracilibacillus thailandensis]MRI67030.1 dTDP-glucose 4,6-dehydratase [Gracilibacillus thailandensis]
MKILITGGAGFIGGNFVSYMIDKYPTYEIYNLDALTYAGDLAKHEAIRNYKNYHFIKENIVNRAAIYSLFQQERFDCVVHFAAESHVDRSIEDPEVFTRTNVLGTQVLLDAANDIGIKKFIHISTDEVYGDLELDSNTLFTETTPIQPSSPYSASKASSDLLVHSYYRTYHLPVNITRCSNNYGPYQHAEKLIPLTISKVLNKQKIPVYGDGKNVRDWLHVYDHCAAVDLVLHEGVNGEVYNIGGNNEKSNIDIVSSIIEMLDGSLDLIEYVTDRLGHDRRYAIDSSKISKLGWKPMYKFNTGLEKTIDWYVRNQNFFKEKVNENGNV